MRELKKKKSYKGVKRDGGKNLWEMQGLKNKERKKERGYEVIMKWSTKRVRQRRNE